jgi:HK97 family phage major capsid protein
MSDIIQRAMLALADLQNDGGMLNPEQNNTFIRMLIDQPTMLRQVRSVPMAGPTMELNKIGFGSRILRAARQATAGDGRALLEAERAKPTTGKVELATKEVIAEIRLPYEVLEDNIERGDLENTILALIAERAALDLEELILQGDTASGDAYLALMDGVLKLADANIVDAANASISAALFNSMVKALPTPYRRNRAAMAFFVPMDVEQDYRLALSNRGTALGDDLLTGNRPVPVFGTPMRPAALMPEANLLFTDPQNVIFGIQRNVRVESERLISEREVKIVLTARIAVEIEEKAAMTKLINLG